MQPLAPHVAGLYGVSIPNEKNTLLGAETVAAARGAGIDAVEAETVATALSAIATINPNARVLICGSLYLAGSILRENG